MFLVLLLPNRGVAINRKRAVRGGCLRREYRLGGHEGRRLRPSMATPENNGRIDTIRRGADPERARMCGFLKATTEPKTYWPNILKAGPAPRGGMTSSRACPCAGTGGQDPLAVKEGAPDEEPGPGPDKEQNDDCDKRGTETDDDARDSSQGQEPWDHSRQDEKGRAHSCHPERRGVHAVLRPFQRRLPLDRVLLEKRLFQDHRVNPRRRGRHRRTPHGPRVGIGIAGLGPAVRF